jgi:hypothetical protein
MRWLAPPIAILTQTLVLTALVVATAIAAPPEAKRIKTCVYRGSTKIGCIHRIYESRYGSPSWETTLDCNGTAWGNSRWLWLDESASHIDAARRLSPGHWRVLAWLVGRPTEGYVIRRGLRVWDILDRKQRRRAVARGPDGPAAGLILLGFGAHCMLS